MLETLRSNLDALCDGLNSGGINYTVSLGIFPALSAFGSPLPAIVRASIGEAAVVGGQPSKTTLDRLLAEFERCIRFEGDRGSHPNTEFLTSREFARLLEVASMEVRREFSGCDSLHSLYISDGHPYYAVFWDFAFVIEREPDAFLFIGSSSD